MSSIRRRPLPTRTELVRCLVVFLIVCAAVVGIVGAVVGASSASGSAVEAGTAAPIAVATDGESSVAAGDAVTLSVTVTDGETEPLT